ncbi:MAG: hypothetical protein GF308_10985, partial [Candidatus Heimdallarchaeota archaeon]|nr:hypothetical protein [Candidatus Heimdallarchaeota archaeon]
MKNNKLLSGLIVLCLFLVVPATIAIIVAPSDTIARTPDFEIIDNMETKQTFTGSVSQGSDSTQHTFDVSSNAEKIEVELSFSTSYDFDLSLWDDQNRRTGGWTSSEHSTSSEIPNAAYSGYSANPETITVDPPATTGTWSVGCFAYSGSGSYTITVTITDSAPDTTPPTVSITNPTDGSTVSGTVTISATASDNVGVSKVSCKVDSGTWSDDTSSPYEWTWDTTGFSDGTHTITCRAYDAAGNYADDQITVTVDNTQGDWGITASDFTSTSTHSVIRYMGGTSPGYDITVTELHIRCGSSGTVSIALYTGGSLSDPTSAVRRTEAHGISVSSGWNTIDVNDYVVPANSVAWIGWAHSCSVYYSTSSSDAGDFQSGRGRWSQSSPSNYDENTALPTNPGSGSFSNYWYAVYAHYTTQPPDDTTPPTIEITSPSDGATLTTSDVTIYWSGSDAGTGIDHYEIRIDSGSWVDKGTSTSHSYTGLADGGHTVDVMA